MRILILLTAACLALGTPARAADSVDMTLVLVSDVSRSVDDAEFKLQKEGYIEAFTSRQVIGAIRGGSIGAIAVAYVEFASSSEVRTVVDWTVIRDEASARDFADRIVAAPRSFWGRTAISSGIDRAVQLLAENGFETQRRVIDVAGDGTNNAGRDVTEARDDAVRAGITINGLAIINEHPVSWTYAHVQPPGDLTGPGPRTRSVRPLGQPLACHPYLQCLRVPRSAAASQGRSGFQVRKSAGNTESRGY